MTFAHEELVVEIEKRFCSFFYLWKIKFFPFEDLLGIGHTFGFTTMLVPGSGALNFDSIEINAFESKKVYQIVLLKIY